MQTARFHKMDKTEVEIDINTTLGQFLELFKKQTGLNCDLLLHSCAETAEEGSPSGGACFDAMHGNKQRALCQ